MNTPPFSVAEVFRRHGESFLAAHGFALSRIQRRALLKVAACRTAALGGHLYRCDACGHERIAYNSCRNRHCPSCLAYRSADWLRDRLRELLPVPYFHLVFTIPASIAELALGNQTVIYSILFRAAASALLEVAKNPAHLGADIGFLAILHTWSQTLIHHPHIHCVIPGGGLSADSSIWIPSRKNFFLPVRVLSIVFRGKFIAALRHAYDQGKLRFAGSTEKLATPISFERWLKKLRRSKWVVYAKPPFGSPEIVLKYLAAYTHRVAISNRRILNIANDTVTFRVRDPKGLRSLHMTLPAHEFIRRFLLHVLPRGFTRIRYFGFLSHRVRKQKLERCRELLGAPQIAPDLIHDETAGDSPADLGPLHECPACHSGQLLLVLDLSPVPGVFRPTAQTAPSIQNTS
jgi:hypothetical protein